MMLLVKVKQHSYDLDVGGIKTAMRCYNIFANSSGN
jgi:hypothetical protein